MSSQWQKLITSLNIDHQPQPLADNALYLLDQQRLLAVDGPDASTLLQGQLSCDIRSLNAGQSGLGCHSTAKGRMLSSFRLCVATDQQYLLRLHHSIAESAHAALAKYAVFSKVNIKPDNRIAIGLHGPLASARLAAICPQLPQHNYQQQLLDNGTVLICISANLKAYELYAEPQQLLALWPDLAEGMPLLDQQQHYLVEHHEGLAFIQQATADNLIPQMLNYQALPAISFRKGCYTGQEIVARMQYLGKLKRHMYRFKVRSTQLPVVGDELFIEQQAQSIGLIASAVGYGDGCYDVLLVLTDEAANASALLTRTSRLDDMQPQALPYQLPT